MDSISRVASKCIRELNRCGKARKNKAAETSGRKEVPTDLVPGDSIYFQRDFVKHFGIYAAYVTTSMTQPGDVKEEDFWTVAKNDKYEQNSSDGENHKPFPSIYKIVKIARSRIGYLSYNLKNYNCEHFVNECRYGERWSKQVEDVLPILSSVSSSTEAPTMEEMECLVSDETDTPFLDNIMKLRETLYRLEFCIGKPENYSLNLRTLAEELCLNPNDYVTIVKKIEEWEKERILTAEGLDYVKKLSNILEKLQTLTEDHSVLKEIAQSLLKMPEICGKKTEEISNLVFEFNTNENKDMTLFLKHIEILLRDVNTDSTDSDDQSELEKLAHQLIKEPGNHVEIVEKIVNATEHRTLSAGAYARIEALRVASKHISQKDAYLKELTRLAKILSSQNGCFGEDTSAYLNKLIDGPDFLDMETSEMKERVKEVHKFSKLILNALSHSSE